MDFVDKKKSICTLGGFCSYRAVSSKLPIAINESALYAGYVCIGFKVCWTWRIIDRWIDGNHTASVPKKLISKNNH